MSAVRLRPIPNRPILEILGSEESSGGLLAFADLHLGLGAGERRADGPPEASSHRMVEGLLEVARERSAAGFVVAGDVKHPVVGTPRPLRPIIFNFFAGLLAEGYSVDLVLGNHDPGLVPHLPREVKVHSSKGAVLRGVGFFHGHRWPNKELFSMERLVVGHLHPGYRLAPTPEASQSRHRCWVRVEYPPGWTPGGDRSKTRPKVRELVVLPAFNPLAGIEALNHERPARFRTFLLRRFLNPGVSRAFLLDGTDLGTLLTTRPAARP